MNREQIDELAAGYALGSLDVDDRGRFEALLRSGDPEAVASLQEFQAAVVDLSATHAETPPPRVRTALMARIASERRGVTPVVTAPARPRRRFWPVVWAGTMAAGIAAIAVGFVVSTTYERRVAELSREATTLREELERQQGLVAILRDPTTQVVALAGQAPSPEARGRMLWHVKAGGLLVSAGLPAPPAGKTYQLWAIADAKPISAGVFSVDAAGTASVRVAPLPGVSRVDAFAVTLEPAGGLPAPSGPMYLVGKS
jgi:anti-sigma-K factor RskA